MKLPASVIQEALQRRGRWTGSGLRPETTYAFPRQFDGCHGAPGHVLIAGADLFARSAASADAEPFKESAASADAVCHADQLLILTAPPVPPTDMKTPKERKESSFYSASPCLYPEKRIPAEQIMYCLTELYDRMEAWEEALNTCEQDIAGIQRMLELTAVCMNGSLGLIDVSYNMPAYTKGMADGLGLQARTGVQRPDDANIASLSEDPQITAIRSVRGVHSYENPLSHRGEGASLYRNMFRPGEDTYYNRLLFARDAGNYSATDAFMVEVLARKIEKITVHLSTFSLPSSEFAAAKKLILRMTEEDYRYDAAAAAALHQIGWHRNDCCRFYIFSYMYPERDNGITEYILRSIEHLIPSSCGEVKDGRILLLQNVTRGQADIQDIRSRLAEFLRENMYKAGVSGMTYSAEHLRGAYLQAEAAIRLGTDRDPMFWYYLFEDYRMAYLIRKSVGEIPPVLLIMPALQALLNGNDEKGTQYLETLRVYSEENFNVTRTAERLFVHRTSLQDRLNRIRERTGLDMDDPAVRFDLLFSLRLLGGEETGVRPVSPRLPKTIS